MLAHGFGAGGAVVAHRARPVDGDDRPRNHAPVDAAGVHAAVLGPQDADHVLIVGAGCRREAVALARLAHDVVVLLKGLERKVGLVGANRGALAQGLAHVAAAARLHTGEDVVLGARDVDDQRLVVRAGREDRLAARSFGRHCHTGKDGLLFLGAEEVVERGDALGLELGGRRLGPDGPVGASQVVVAVRLVVVEAREGDDLSVADGLDAAPGRAAGNRRLVGCPYGGLFDGQGEAELGRLRLHLGEGDLVDLNQ